VAVSEVVAEAPATIETEAGEAESEKSGAGGGGGGWLPPPPPPPQLEIPKHSQGNKKQTRRIRFGTSRLPLHWAIQKSLTTELRYGHGSIRTTNIIVNNF
jgi:hypothetical protein